MTDRKYDAEYRLMAVKLALRHKSQAAAARQLGIPRSRLACWIKSYRNYASKGLSKAMMEQLQVDNDEKDRKIAALEEELEILKKAAAYFARSLQ